MTTWRGRVRRGPCRLRARISIALLCAAGSGSSAYAQAASAAESQLRVLDEFDRIEAWSTQSSGGAMISIRSETGALRLDFDFQAGTGQATVRRALAVRLPPNYEFNFRIRGQASASNLEFRLLDTTRKNVWSAVRRNLQLSATWDTLHIRKRHIRFASGPRGSGDIESVAAIEFTITAPQGGSGTIWLDQLVLQEREPDPPYEVPDVKAASAEPGRLAGLVIDRDTTTAWRSAVDFDQWLELDFKQPRELGGLIIDWDPADYATDYEVRFSEDGKSWSIAYTVEGGNGGRDWIRLPETETRHLQLGLKASARGRGYAIRNVAIQPIEWGSTPNDLFTAMARAAPPGTYPRYFSGQATYWTTIGADDDAAEALVSEDGAIEIARDGPLLEPLVLIADRLRSWADVKIETRLADGELPIPEVRWLHPDSLVLTVTAFVAGAKDAATLYVRYRLENHGAAPVDPTLFIAIRPFQVNPFYKGMARPGGRARIDEIGWDGRAVTVNGLHRIVPLVAPTSFGTVTFAQGDITDHLRAGQLPARPMSVDPEGLASAALAFGFVIEPGAVREASIAVPLNTSARVPSPGGRQPEASDMFVRELATAAASWRTLLNAVDIQVPAQAERVIRTLRSSLAWIRIHRDGPAIQSGSRNEGRAWMRAASLTAAELLRLGQADVVRQFIEWFATLQAPDGTVPCCAPLADSAYVAQDSHGQLLYLIAEYHRHTEDRTLLQRLWPNVERAVAHIDSLRQTRKTAEYRADAKRVYFGLMPSGEAGDTTRPAHSYQDQYFTLRGLSDAAYIADVLGHGDARDRYRTMRDDFRRDLLASLRAVMTANSITYLPASVERADFDATSLALAMAPGGEQANLPQDALTRTFERYWQNFVARRDGRLTWDSYSPHELRIVGAFVRLGWKARVTEALDFFFRDQRPAGWNQWPEIVTREPRVPRFPDDMPHGWVAADYIGSVLDMFAFERESDDALVLGAGIPDDWVTEGAGVSLRGLSTHYGRLDFSMRADDGRVTIRIGGELRVPPGGIVVRSPLGVPITRALADGRVVGVQDGKEVRLERVPTELVLYY